MACHGRRASADRKSEPRLAIGARLVSAIVGVMLLCGPANAQAPAPAQGQVPLGRIEAYFAGLKAEGVDLSGRQRWCYFFLSYDRARLDAAAKDLVAQGYTVVQLQAQPNALPDGPPVWQLEVRRIEHLTPQDVSARDVALAAFADKAGSIHYDGTEIEPAN